MLRLGPRPMMADPGSALFAFTNFSWLRLGAWGWLKRIRCLK